MSLEHGGIHGRTAPRYGKRAEPRIVDAATHPREFVNLTVAATYLEMDRRALNYFIAQGRIPVHPKGRGWKVRVADLVTFNTQQRCRERAD